MLDNADKMEFLHNLGGSKCEFPLIEQRRRKSYVIKHSNTQQSVSYIFCESIFVFQAALQRTLLLSYVYF